MRSDSSLNLTSNLSLISSLFTSSSSSSTWEKTLRTYHQLFFIFIENIQYLKWS